MKFDWNIFIAAVASWVAARASERSSYLGLVALAGSFGIVIEPELAQWIISGSGLIAGFILLATKDKAAQTVIQVTEVKTVEAPKAQAAGEKQILKG